ncbi:G2/mitotic-specific cyclin-B3-like [Mercenaria mercenaria]|uniref:G2/mitotic-specific cyclin-B3-like n=1 Tax=Mercenaria mercenaria TaxID=6596 RepID=UPI00234F296A|nr:G2/mitotic-specific cyclin-B3-like [Mercenaria mercenaria]
MVLALQALADKSNIKVALKKSKLPSQLPKPTLPAPKASKENKVVKKEKKQKSGVQKSASSDNLTDESVLSLVACSQESSGSSVSSSQESLASTADISCQGVEDLIPLEDEEKEESKPQDIDDVDKENMQDPVQVALYAWDIFKYYKDRELQFHVQPYMAAQKFLTTSMRAILVDWLVEVQENFELNHETLYLAVKLVDMYVSRRETPKEALQLIGAVSLFIASKFDERCPPLVEDFLYICDDAYKRKEFLDMERCILKTIGFDIGMPLSYRFLRRYAKCGRANMETLTLARYILEMSLMEYEFVSKRESEMAAASLWLALKMKKAGDWTNTLVHYTGYKEEEITPMAKKLNKYITEPPKQLTTIRSKYSHKVFYEVAKTPTLTEADFL